MHEEFISDDLWPSLGHLIEEMGEVQSAAGKIVRFGFESVNPLLPLEEQETNRDWLLREMEDVRLAMIRLQRAIEADLFEQRLIKAANESELKKGTDVTDWSNEKFLELIRRSDESKI